MSNTVRNVSSKSKDIQLNQFNRVDNGNAIKRRNGSIKIDPIKISSTKINPIKINSTEIMKDKVIMSDRKIQDTKDDNKKRREMRKKELDNLPWIEKHRPYRFENVKVDDQIKTEVQRMISNKDLPNIIMEGPPGVGKTSTIKCIAREIYKKYYNNMVLEMNASDDRGISIQDSIENFRKAYVHIDEQDKTIIPKFKMVILDEADNMTDKAKHIISSFVKNAINDLRFAFTCNIKDNISTSIQSGCHIVKYPPLADNIIKDRILEICKIEGIINKNTDEQHLKQITKGIHAITQITNGDLRTAINKLQLTYNRYNDISDDMVFKINDKPHPQKSKEIIVCCLNQNLGEAMKKVLDMRQKGYSGTDICLGLHLALRIDICNDIPEIVKIEMWKCIGYSSYNISKGLDSSVLQISACISDMYKCVKDLKIRGTI